MFLPQSALVHPVGKTTLTLRTKARPSVAWWSSRDDSLMTIYREQPKISKFLRRIKQKTSTHQRAAEKAQSNSFLRATWGPHQLAPWNRCPFYLCRISPNVFPSKRLRAANILWEKIKPIEEDAGWRVGCYLSKVKLNLCSFKNKRVTIYLRGCLNDNYKFLSLQKKKQKNISGFLHREVQQVCRSRGRRSYSARSALVKSS